MPKPKVYSADNIVGVLGFLVDRIKQLWFPIAILVIIVVTVGWILATVVYPSNVQSREQVVLPTATASTTPSPTARPTMTASLTPSPTQASSTPSPTPTPDCTYPLGYWRDNPQEWLIEDIMLGNLSYSKDEALAILDSEDPGPTERLLAAFLVAQLNTLNGADSSTIDQALVAARDWLILRPHGIDLTEEELLEVQELAQQLQDYNEGLSGPGSCLEATPTATPEENAPTATSTATATLETPTSTATPAAAGTSSPATSVPRRTPTPTNSKPRPSNTPPPPPTSTQPPPPPTSTQPPPPTNPPPPTPTNPPPPPTQGG